MPGVSAPVIELRDYQRDAINAVHRAWAGQQRGTGVGPVARAAVVLPTGAGKTVVFAHPDFRNPVIGGDALGRGALRMLILVHRDELAVQTVAKLRTIDPAASVGRVQNVWDETSAQIIVASVQTLASPARRERIRGVGLIVVDEAHHAVAPTYLQVLDHFGAFRPQGATFTAGFSATLARAEDDGHLGDVWQEVVLRKDIVDGIRGGWLVDVKGKQVKLEALDLRNVKRSHGDYSEKDLGEQLVAADAPEHVAEAYVELAGDRQGIAFWPTVDAAEAGAEAMTRAGIPSAAVLGSTPIPQREAVYADLRAGRLQVLSSCGVHTEGFDMPQLSCAVVARPTGSAPLYVQMAGRVLRPWHLPVPGYPRKTDALILDVVGVTGRHKLATLADLSVTVKAVGEEQTLRDASDAEAIEETGVRPPAVDVDQVTGHRVVRDIDLFGDRSSLWLQTRLGTWFIPAGDWTVFLWPAQYGLWDIGVTPVKGLPGQAQPVATGMTLDWAMQQAEVYARKVVESRGGTSFDQRKASWRRSAPATESQKRHAASLGLRVPEGARKAEVADAITIAYATRALGG